MSHGELELEVRARFMLGLAQEISMRGDMIAKVLDDDSSPVRMDWFDNRASDLIDLVCVDYGIPARFVDDTLLNLLMAYTSQRADIDEVLAALERKRVELGGEEGTVDGTDRQLYVQSPFPRKRVIQAEQELKEARGGEEGSESVGTD